MVDNSSYLQKKKYVEDQVWNDKIDINCTCWMVDLSNSKNWGKKVNTKKEVQY